MAAKRIAVVGASSDPTKLTGRPIAYMLQRGFKGEIVPINPSRTEIQGLRAYHLRLWRWTGQSIWR